MLGAGHPSLRDPALDVLCLAADIWVGRPMNRNKNTHDQPFSSRLSSLKKRQSVPWAMILLGADLIMPASRSRRA